MERDDGLDIKQEDEEEQPSHSGKYKLVILVNRLFNC